MAIKAVGAAFDLEDVADQLVPQQLLLQREQRARVLCPLTQLHLSLPRVLRRHLVARLAVARAHNKLDQYVLLQRDTALDLRAQCQPQLQTARVWFRPYPFNVDNVHALRASQLARTQSQKLCALQLSLNPLVLRALPFAARLAHDHFKAS
eukprot:6174321-Pleurochrysis_carterae.AAC.1